MEVIFESLPRSESGSILPLHLHDYLLECRILGWNWLFPEFLKTFLYCLLSSSVADKPSVFLTYSFVFFFFNVIVISLWKVLESFLYPGVLNFQRSVLQVGLFIVIMLVPSESFIYFIGKLSCTVSLVISFLPFPLAIFLEFLLFGYWISWTDLVIFFLSFCHVVFWMS